LSGPTTEVSAHSAGCEEVPRVWPFNATDKLDPDVRELLSMHCSWCVLDCGEAHLSCGTILDASLRAGSTRSMPTLKLVLRKRRNGTPTTLCSSSSNSGRQRPLLAGQLELLQKRHPDNARDAPQISDLLPPRRDALGGFSC